MASSNSIRSGEDQVLVEEKLFARTLIFNRPRQLNALSFEMISRMLELFHAYDEDSSIKLVIVKGKGRAFCAGGDVVPFVHDIKKGEYAGLTCSRLDGAEMLVCGLATHFVPSARLPSLEEDLCKVDSSDSAIISEIIDKYSQQPNLKENSAYLWLDVIDKCFSRRMVEEIISALEREAEKKADDWISATIQTLKKASPTSLKISLRSIREGRLQGIGQCLVREYRMVCHVLKGHVSKDFVEGCRALLLDKDKNPKWNPSKLELITDHMVDQYFSKVDDGDFEDLNLPARSNLPVYAISKL